MEVYGCTANKSDASLMLGLLKEKKHEIVENINEADTLILLTCTVIGTTEQRMLSRLKVFKKTNKRVIVAGCMASVQADLIKSIAPNATLLSPQHVQHIVDVIERKNVQFVTKYKVGMPRHFDGVTAPIAIAEGCDLSCSYCIVSKARGKLVSYPVKNIVEDVYEAVKHGCKEIQITAQDTASYGLDTKDTLADLLNKLCEITGDFRIRIGMMNPSTVLDRLDETIDAFGHDKVYKFLHLPVQSGDDKILKKMNRKYTVNDFLEIIRKFREKHQDITISTDIIPGFPSENDKQFYNTINLLKKVKPDIVNITRFSTRPLTQAKKMKEKIPTHIAKERSKLLTELSKKTSLKKNRCCIGKKYLALITKNGKDNTMMGRIENYKPVIIKNRVDLGDFIPIKITDATASYLLGKLI
jgi:MiaB-like tRNA modifying enzyme